MCRVKPFKNRKTKVISSPGRRAQRRGRSWAGAGVITLVAMMAGCGASLTMHPGLVVTPNTASLDTNCTGCNRSTETGAIVEAFSARMTDGSAADVKWSVAEQVPEARAGAGSIGTINAEGEFTPPNFLTADEETVVVTATMAGDPKTSVSVPVRITPGFFSPLTPQNIALAPGGMATISGVLAEAGGESAIHFALAEGSDKETAGADLGRVGTTHCQRSNLSSTNCTVVYTAPAAVSSPRLINLVATVGAAHTTATILVNPSGISSSPVLHQNEQFGPVMLGSSGGHGQDYESNGSVITGCCGGTLGALVEDNSGAQYVLSNNHVLALSDQAAAGDGITQPGLIDNDCSPAGVTAIASLSAFLPLSSAHTNVDAAIAQVATGMVDPSGRILELGAKQADGTLSAGAPGVSSTGGRGETVTPWLLPLAVAKSGRTTGLTCANVSAVNLDLTVDYFKDCAETVPYLSKTFTNQIAVSGNGFTDAGDSGSLIVDASNAEPVGLYFAGGTDVAGVSQAVANPAPEVLTELAGLLSSEQHGNASLSFVGGADHAVSCLSYGDSTVTAAQARVLPASEQSRAQAALSEAHGLVNPATGVLAVAMGKSNDHLGEAAIVVAAEEGSSPEIPQAIGGVRTQIVWTDAKTVQAGRWMQHAGTSALALPAATLNAAIAVKKQIAVGLMKQTPGFFGVGVGGSLDNSREAALVIYVDRRRAPAELPVSFNGVRARYILMDRMHVTQSYAASGIGTKKCGGSASGEPSLENLLRPSMKE